MVAINMTTDVMMPLELMTPENGIDQSDVITGTKSCFDNVELPLLPRIILYIFLLISSACHLLVIIVCIRQRRKATYKQDIVYMVALAIVDMLSCVLAPVMRPGVRKTNIAIRSLLPLLTYMSVMLLAIRAVDRFNIFIRKQAKPWSFRFQIILCLVSNLFVTVPMIYSNLLTNIPFALIFGLTASLIILVSYVAIVCKLLQKARKSSLRISPTQPMLLSERQSNVTNDAHSAMKEGQNLKGSLSLGTATDQSTGPPITNKTEISINETSQIPNVVVINHSSLRPDHTVIEKILHQQKNNEVILAQASKHMVEENKEVSIAQTNKEFGNEYEEMVSEETIKHPGKEQKKEVLAQNSKQLGKENKDVLFAQTKETFGKENREVDRTQKGTQMRKERRTEEHREVDQAPENTQMGKERRSEVPLHVNRNKTLTTRRNKGKHLRRASLSLVFITIIFYLSWFPAWMRDISDSVPCYLLLLVFVNCTVNPFIYLITLKTFRQEYYNLIFIPFRRLCKSN